ncbi:AfsR/SARP family transcriptional regulator [Kibdelosporangium phytohabitans]|uniref:OmpR/PhoB-type domain-containing protein n=1 Tax=Kibdelosporangium phytohabitans TaxID=860235 RepID=A0A0N9IEX4_9PSEU|nr:AfsR/SARP family transcriptional regulator [Kibdelosporangium phytohabitans]ALG13323.1 hypothetical protein AOZ06_46465 [Kibdelosporangium phytohabitans]MBE1465106.1 DNA-binding SARP family transcriptional activator [Kibdelosporangium phytohabitans]
MPTSGDALSFNVLGPLEALRAGRFVTPSAAKQRNALAALLLSANSYVSQDYLIERIWDANVPKNARDALFTIVTRLRHTLGGQEELIRTRSGGYIMCLEPDQLDLLRFRHLAEQTEQLRGALALWRRPLLANVPSESLHRDDVPQLVEERLTATERLVEICLRRGHHDETIRILREATADHPYREHLWAQLMTALTRSGRRAEALQTYHGVIANLRDELGIDPGRHLVRVHADILADARRPAGTPLVRPRQLPPDLARFTGRTAALERLDEMLWPNEQRPAIAVIGGAAGVGKTALAVHWAHRVRDQFPDGQIYLDMRASGAEPRVEPFAALGTMLRSFDVPAERVPGELDARSALLRSTLAGKKVLILLDDAGDAAQVRPLLPNSESLVLVVSRSRLSGLAALDGAQHLILGQLDTGESLALLATLLGARRVDAEPGAAAELAHLCGHLPLALAIGAERAGRRPDADLADVVDQLRDERARLDLLSVDDDPKASLRAVLARSYDTLDSRSARAFRLLGLHDGPDIGLGAAAVFLGTSQTEARQLADSLTHRCLLELVGRDRYRFHDLVRIYAAERATEHERETVRKTLLRQGFSCHSAA